ncbi:MAG: GTPase Era [Anaerolineales bacterium]|nr:MAG: GTPase Era [Anaerolineales bacterium]
MDDLDPNGLYLEEPELPPDHRSGFVAVVGRPNVGKSTLMNAYLGQKIAIVSDKPQTTRNRLLGILTRDDAQIIFVDTPGIHAPLHKLGEVMVEMAMRAIPDADVVLFMVDASVPPTGQDTLVAEAIREQGGELPVVIALNKVDLLPSPESPYAEAYLGLLQPAAWLPVSATRGDNRDDLLNLVVAQLPLGPRYYPEDQITDQQTRFIAAELIREAALGRLHQEVPHSLAVVVNEFKQRSENMTYISATLFVERDTQKGIVIGQGGRTLKDIGRAARAEIEKLAGTSVFLELWVKVRPKWRKKEDELRRLGYALPKR